MLQKMERFVEEWKDAKDQKGKGYSHQKLLMLLINSKHTLWLVVFQISLQEEALTAINNFIVM